MKIIKNENVNNIEANLAELFISLRANQAL